jgi:hypothetical protein
MVHVLIFYIPIQITIFVTARSHGWKKKFFYIHKCITSILASLRFWLQATITNQTPLGVPAVFQCMKRPKTTLGLPPVSVLFRFLILKTHPNSYGEGPIRRTREGGE